MAETLARKLAPTNKFRRDVEAKIARFDQELEASKSAHAPKQASMFPDGRSSPIIRRPYVRGSETSLQAAASISPVAAKSQKERIFAVIQGAPKGLTDEEISQKTGITPSTVRPRRGELQRDNKIYDSGLTRLSQHKRRMAIYKARA